MLSMSYGLAIMLLLVYIGSRIYLHNPFGEDNAFDLHPHVAEEAKLEQKRLEEGDPEISQWAGIILLFIAVAIMAVTAEWVGT